MKQNKSAIALKYDKATHHAPQVTAKGSELVAEEILRLAREHEVPIYEDPELTVALSQIDIGDEIPESLYLAIAEVIAFVYQLEGQKSDKPRRDTRQDKIMKRYT